MRHYSRIRDLREDMDLTQTELCQKLYMHKTTYTNYEQGKHTVLLDFAVSLADFYNVSVDYIAGRTIIPNGINNSGLDTDEINLIEKFLKLFERNKGRAEQFIDQLYKQQEHKKTD